MADADYKIEGVHIRPVENGYIVRCEKALTEKARAKLRVQKKAPTLEHYKAKEVIADDLEDVLDAVKKLLKGSDPKTAFDEAFDEDADE